MSPTIHSNSNHHEADNDRKSSKPTIESEEDDVTSAATMSSHHRLGNTNNNNNTITPMIHRMVHHTTSTIMKRSKNKQQQQQQQQQQGSTKSSSSSFSPSSDTTTTTTTTTTTSTTISRMVWTSRMIFLLFLCILATVLSYGAYKLLTYSEQLLAEEHFNGLSKRALDEALQITIRKRLGAKVLASVISYTFPTANQSWPNISIAGFEGLANNIIDTTEEEGAGTTMGFCPLVWPNQLQEFEQYAYQTAFTTINSHYPTTTGLRDFSNGSGNGYSSSSNSDNENEPILEQGVHGYRYNDDGSSLEIYHETDGSTYWNSSYKILTPFIMHSAGPPLLMFNLHSMSRFGTIIDEILDCASQSTTTTTNNSTTTIVTNEEDEDEDNTMKALSDSSYLNKCAILSDMITMYNKDGEPSGPSAYIMQPIYPAHDIDTITGFITSSMKWQDVVERLFSLEVSGIDCVLETETQSYTYTITNGAATIKGQGDLHDTSYDEYGQSIDLYSPGIFTHTSAHYKLTIYPNEDLFDVFGTPNPVIALVGSLCIMFFTSILFIVYDHLVQKELYRKQAITEARRRFVRFISHEIRTPMNTICMGANLVQETMSKFSKQYSALSLEFPPSNPTVSFDDSKTLQVHQQKYSLVGAEECLQQLQEQLRDWSDVISDVLVNANCAVNVLGDLLNYDKVESGTLPLELTIIPIWSLIQRVASEFRLAAGAKNIQYKVDCSCVMPRFDGEEEEGEEDHTKGTHDDSIDHMAVPSVDIVTDSKKHSTRPVDVRVQHAVGDPIRISQILRSFISNALEFTQNTGEINIHVSWKPLSAKHFVRYPKPNEFILDQGHTVNLFQSGYVQVDVQNSGEGVSEEELGHIFGDDAAPFDMDKLQSGQGSGLGLYMSKGIAEQHGGYVKVSSKGLAHGTCFTLVLPLHHVPDSDLPECLKNSSPKQPQQHPSDDVENANMENVSGDENGDSDDDARRDVFRILVVDDAKVCRKLLMRLLKTKGHVCEEAENGLRAVEMMKKAMDEGNAYDTVLLDYEMPVMVGPDAAAEMRKMGCHSFIAGLTGNVIPEDVQYFKKRVPIVCCPNLSIWVIWRVNGCNMEFQTV